MRLIFSILSAVPVVLAMIFAGVIIDVGLTSIYAHFGWEFWPTFTVIGAIIGMIVGFSKAHWRFLTIAIYALAGYVLAQQWMIDGIVYSLIIIGIYSAIEGRFD